MLRKVRQSTDTWQIPWLKTCALGNLHEQEAGGYDSYVGAKVLTGVATLHSFVHCSPQTGPPVSPPSASPECPSLQVSWRMAWCWWRQSGKGNMLNSLMYSILITLLGVWRKLNNLDHPTHRAKIIKEWESSLLKTRLNLPPKCYFTPFSLDPSAGGLARPHASNPNCWSLMLQLLDVSPCLDICLTFL